MSGLAPFNQVVRCMFYVFVITGFVIFFAGLSFAPGWWKLAWIATFVGVLAYLPLILARFLDPFNATRIRKYCAEVGVTDVEIQPFPNHYGVHFRKNDRKHYAKCRVSWGKVTWKGPSPAEI